MSSLTVGSYALAHNLIGFYGFDRQPVRTLRVKVTEVRGPYVWIVTADLVDAGTPLTLDASQVQPFEAETATYHREGLVAFA